jgi:hypothetical protein
MLAAQARPQQPPPQGIFQRLIKIKYNAELFLINAAKHSVGSKKEMDATKDVNMPSIQYESLDSALAIYNTIRWNMDGLVYQISGDLVAANSPKKLRQLNDWCLNNEVNNKIQPSIEALENIERLCQEYLPAFSPISKNINLTTNVFYLIKDSYSLIKGLSDLRTQKTTALVEILDQMRLASPQELLKQVK